ncbi:TOBE domain-containing protein, partial [Mesorhizobium sp. L2C067A000]|uniref:TOBE domain-containing protein n=2 Tax=Mesorhizobium TaxID=68287 RepID=UPI0004CE85D3
LLLDMPGRGNAPGPAMLAVRPNAVRILPGQPAGTMKGRVVKSSYLGDHMEYRIAISNPAVELFATSPDVTPAVAEGTMVGIDFDPAKIVLIKDD